MDTIDTNEVRFTMRIENNLYERIKEAAKKSKRSIAKEIEYQLEQYQLLEYGIVPPEFKALDHYVDKFQEHDFEMQRMFELLSQNNELLEKAIERLQN